MKTIAHLTFLALLSSSFILTACNTSTTEQSYEMAEAGENEFIVQVPEGVSTTEVQRAIEFSLTNRGWSVVQSDEGSIEAVLDHRGVSATLDITFDNDSIRIVSHATDEDGQELVPLRWIEFLREDIQKQLLNAASV